MNKEIEVLDDLTISKIAAGEIIDAPHSVVKELVENSIDAEATIITLEIKEGGKKYIRVTDNGIGIDEKYVEQAFMRHSTSKITNANDLNNINSLGFRGEALASIAAISQVKMVTRTENQEYGILIEIIGGNIKTVKKTACSIGTSVEVKNLFFNTPARLKFMKSNSAETMEISKIITRLSISTPSVSFRYINNNNTVFVTPGNDILSQVILTVFDKDILKNLIFLEANKLDMKLQGYISQPNFVRGNRNLQIIYTNGRYVKSKLISKAIEKAYKERIIINKHPVCILNLSINPSEIDINVHPSKTEVKFENKKQVQEFIYKTLNKTLERDTIIPRLPIMERENQINKVSNSILAPTIKTGCVENTKENNKINVNKNILINETDKYYAQNLSIRENTQSIDKQDKNNEKQAQTDNIHKDIIQSSFLDTLLDQYKIIGQIFNTYIILEKEQSIYLIDQHAAHERLLYNKFLDEVRNEKVASQMLVKPKILELSSEDYILLSNNVDLFAKLGFHIEDFGAGSVIIREVPIILGEPKNFSFIYEILDETKNNSNIADYFEDTIIKKACRKAIKAMDKLNYYEIKQLIEELHTLTPPLTCPHGRPIVLTINQHDIEKHFKRIQ